AHIVKGPDLPLLIARDDHAGIGHATHEIIAGVWNLPCPPSAQPHIEMNCFHLALEPFRISVIALWQSESFGEGELRTSVVIRCRHYLNIATIAIIAKIAEIHQLFENPRFAKPRDRPVFNFGNYPILAVLAIFVISLAAFHPDPPVNPAPG